MENIQPLEQFKDDRGVISTWLRKCDILSVTSKAGSVRASHYHKTSGHLSVVTKGSILYYERPVGSDEKPVITRYKAGDSFWTGPLVEHEMVFDEDSEFWFFSTGCRTQKEYEEDLVRLEKKLSDIQ